MPHLLRQVLVGLGVVALQWLIFGRIRLWGAYPDIVLLFVTLSALRYGRVNGTVTGFWTGLLMDIVYQTWGLHMLVKTAVGFVVGLFRSELGEHLRIQPAQAALGALVVTLLHNGILVLLLALTEGTRTTFLITSLWVGSAIYTAFVATLFSAVRTR
jgi:rod shape-determining protein MreD